MKKTTTFGERLEEALRLAKIDRQQLADALGISVQAVSQVIVGKTKALTAENAARASQQLGVDIMWLSTGEGEPTYAAVQFKHYAGDEASASSWPFRVSQKDVEQLAPEVFRAIDTLLWEFVNMATSANKPADKDWGAPASSGIIPAPKTSVTKRAKHG